MNITPPNDVSCFFDAYLAALQCSLPNRILGCYLYGSVSLGAYDPRLSDLDYMVVLAAPLTKEALDTLPQFHADLCEQFPLARKLEGHYVPLESIRRSAFSEHYPSIAEGCYQGLQGVMTLYWYQLHTCGVRMLGPDPETLFPPIPWEQVLQEMAYNINGYWYRRTQQPAQTSLDDGAVDFAVLTLCRILYTLANHDITSKADAGRWALNELPARWQPLIREVVRIRTSEDTPSHFASPELRAREVREFILAMREICNRQYFSPSSL